MVLGAGGVYGVFWRYRRYFALLARGSAVTARFGAVTGNAVTVPVNLVHPAHPLFTANLQIYMLPPLPPLHPPPRKACSGNAPRLPALPPRYQP